jgi:hypothetical protein
LLFLCLAGRTLAGAAASGRFQPALETQLPLFGKAPNRAIENR